MPLSRIVFEKFKNALIQLMFCFIVVLRSILTIYSILHFHRNVTGSRFKTSLLKISLGAFLYKTFSKFLPGSYCGLCQIR